MIVSDAAVDDAFTASPGILLRQINAAAGRRRDVAAKGDDQHSGVVLPCQLLRSTRP
jgi:hypothetical protein